MAEALELAVQGTPNPNAIKVTLNRTVAARGTTYRDQATAQTEWAKRILGIAGVSQVFAVNNFISVSKRADGDWNIIGPQVEQVLRQAFA